MADPSPVRNLILWTGATMAMSCLLRFLSSYRDRDQQRVVHDQIIEICLSDIESAKKAIAGGANSIELCVDRSSGGVTPSYGLIKEACRLAIGSNVKVNVLIRPRDGNFIYSDDEFDAMLRDIIIARDAGAHGLSSPFAFSHSLTLLPLSGVVVGILRHDQTIDAVRMAVIRSISHPMDLTFHRAFDVCSTPLTQAIDQIIALGCDRLLTSGRASSVTDSAGTQCLSEIMTYLSQRKHPSSLSLQVVAASGVQISNVRELILSTGVTGVHAGSGVIGSSSAPVSNGGGVVDEGFEGEGRGCVDEDRVADLVQAAEESWEEFHS
jgi:copper homeostasis protein